MQIVKIPLTLDPMKAAKMRSTYSGVIEASFLSRLLGASAGFCSDIQVQFSCDTDEHGTVTISGTSQGEVSLTCQRCMKDFNEKLQVKFSYSPLTKPSEEEELPDKYDPVEVDEHGHIEIAKLVEDEFIVSIPFFPMHTVEDCSVKEQDTTVGKIDDSVEERPNPFAVLKNLKK